MTTTTDPGPPPPAPSALPTRSDRFFSWTAGLGIVRGDGWIGGVAAGLAARMRVDPVIVRGILVVVGLFGFPVLFLYGVAWALLPDLDGRIPLQEALRGRFSVALVGVGLFLLAGLVPAPFALLLGAPSLYSLTYFGSELFAVFTLLFLLGAAIAAALIFLIVRAAHRTPGAPVPDLRTASAESEAPDTSADETGSGAALEADGQGRDAVALTAPASPPAPEPGDADELAAWREQHAAWREQDQAWRQQQQDAARAAREQARRERQARATAFAAEASERRRIRRATSPRTPFASVAVLLGLAVIAGAVVALQRGGDLALAFGLFTAALVLAAGMVLAGILRRRSGFLAFATALALAGGLGATALPAAQALHLGDYGISNIGGSGHPASAPFVQPWGQLSVYLDDTGRVGETHVLKRAGSTFVSITPGVEVLLKVTTRTGAIYLSREDEAGSSGAVSLTDEPGVTVESLPDGRLRYTATLAAGGQPVTTRETLVIDQESGYIQMYLEAARPEGDQE